MEQLTMKESVTRHVARMAKICSRENKHFEAKEFEAIAFHAIEILKDLDMEENPHVEVMAFIEQVKNNV